MGDTPEITRRAAGNNQAAWFPGSVTKLLNKLEPNTRDLSETKDKCMGRNDKQSRCAK